MGSRRLLGAGFATGALAAAAILVWAMLQPRGLPRVGPPPVGATGSAPPEDTSLPADLRGRSLAFPVPAVRDQALPDTFLDARGGGRRLHHALDILAPRGSAVVSVDDGFVARLDDSALGGITVYAFDRDRRYCYYYAHLEGRAEGLREGQPLVRGQRVGYVGTSGNAPARTPHLHFALSQVDEDGNCWGGRPIDPWPLLRPGA